MPPFSLSRPRRLGRRANGPAVCQLVRGVGQREIPDTGFVLSANAVVMRSRSRSGLVFKASSIAARKRRGSHRAACSKNRLTPGCARALFERTIARSLRGKPQSRHPSCRGGAGMWDGLQLRGGVGAAATRRLYFGVLALAGCRLVSSGGHNSLQS